MLPRNIGNFADFSFRISTQSLQIINRNLYRWVIDFKCQTRSAEYVLFYLQEGERETSPMINSRSNSKVTHVATTKCCAHQAYNDGEIECCGGVLFDRYENEACCHGVVFKTGAGYICDDSKGQIIYRA